MTERNTLSQFPEIFQSGLVKSEIEYEFVNGQQVYEIKNGPAVTVHSITSGGTTYIEDTDYSLVLNSSGDITSIDWSIGGDSPSNGDIFTVEQSYFSIISRYLEAHDEQTVLISEDLEDIVGIRQIDNIPDGNNKQLERVGALFGRLGRRNGRPFEDYKKYLKSIVASFQGRGSKQGLKFAIAAALDVETSDVEINEDLKNLEYRVRVTNVPGGTVTSVIDELAELADPSGVKLDKSIIVTEGATILFTITGSQTQTRFGLGSGTLDLDGTKQLQ